MAAADNGAMTALVPVITIRVHRVTPVTRAGRIRAGWIAALIPLPVRPLRVSVAAGRRARAWRLRALGDRYPVTLVAVITSCCLDLLPIPSPHPAVGTPPITSFSVRTAPHSLNALLPGQRIVGLIGGREGLNLE